MQNKNKQLLSILLLLIFVPGCLVTYGDNTSSSFTSLSNENCLDSAKSIYLFFEGEDINFSYKKIGIVVSEGKEYASKQEVLDHLKYEAWKNCANGLINIKSNYKTREQGVLFNEESREDYSSDTYEAIAVKIETDSLFISKYGHGEDLSFINNVKKDHEHEAKRTSNQCAFSVAGVIVGVIIAIIAVKKDQEGQ